MKHIQVVEDEPYIARLLATGLTHKGFEVRVASTGAPALEQVAAVRPDVLLLDVMLPDLDGFEVCRRLRACNGHLPILMLTARTAMAEKVAGLDAAAGKALLCQQLTTATSARPSDTPAMVLCTWWLARAGEIKTLGLPGDTCQETNTP